MTNLRESLEGNLVVVYQLDDLSLVQSFWGNFLDESKGLFRFHIIQEKKRYGRRPLDGDISLDPTKITRIMKSEGREHQTMWKMEMGLDPMVQQFYDALSVPCEKYCSGWAGVETDVFYKGGSSTNGVINHEILDEGMLACKKGRADFTLDTRGSRTTTFINMIDRIVVYSWPQGYTKSRVEEIAWQTSPTP